MRILVIAPHCDDELLALHKHIGDWLQAKHKVRIVYVTSSETREAEARQYLASFGSSLLTCRFSKFADGSLMQSLPSLVKELKFRQQAFKPDLVIAPHWLEPMTITSDHLACYLAAQSLPVAKRYYCIWANIRKGKLPAPRSLGRKLKWLLRSLLLPWPKGETVRLAVTDSKAKYDAFYQFYKSQADLPKSLIVALCRSEALYR